MRRECLVLLLQAAADRGGTDLTVLSVTSTDNTTVHSARDAVLHLAVVLGQVVHIVGTGFLHITKGSRVNDVADLEALDGLRKENPMKKYL